MTETTSGVISQSLEGGVAGMSNRAYFQIHDVEISPFFYIFHLPY